MRGVCLCESVSGVSVNVCGARVCTCLWLRESRCLCVCMCLWVRKSVRLCGCVSLGVCECLSVDVSLGVCVCLSMDVSLCLRESVYVSA